MCKKRETRPDSLGFIQLDEKNEFEASSKRSKLITTVSTNYCEDTMAAPTIQNWELTAAIKDLADWLVQQGLEND